MKTKHTKGPWNVYTMGTDKLFGICTDRTERMETDITRHTSIIKKADADLIAAAPEMLEAMNMLACELDHVMRTGKKSNLHNEIVELYGRVVKKARGES